MYHFPERMEKSRVSRRKVCKNRRDQFPFFFSSFFFIHFLPLSLSLVEALPPFGTSFLFSFCLVFYLNRAYPPQITLELGCFMSCAHWKLNLFRRCNFCFAKLTDRVSFFLFFLFIFSFTVGFFMSFNSFKMINTGWIFSLFARSGNEFSYFDNACRSFSRVLVKQ